MWVTGEYYDALRDAETAARGRLGEAQPDPLARLDWFKRSWRCEPLGHRPLIVRARVSGAEAWLFFVRPTRRSLAPLAGPHTQRFGPVFIGEPEPAVQHMLLRAAARRLVLFGIRRIALAPMVPDQAAAVRSAFGRGGWVVAEQRHGTRFGLSAPDQGFDAYWDSRPEALHEHIAIGSRTLNVEISDLLSPRLWSELELLAGSDHFLRDLAEDATLDRTLRLAIARVGDAPVAAQVWTTEGGNAWRHWRTEDADARHLHPSAQLTAAMLRYLMNVDHVRDIDLGMGTEAELGSWADARQPLVRLSLFNAKAPSQWVPALAAQAATLVRRPRLD